MNISRTELNEFIESYNEEMNEITAEIVTNRDYIERLLTIVEGHQAVISQIKEKIEGSSQVFSAEKLQKI